MNNGAETANPAPVGLLAAEVMDDIREAYGPEAQVVDALLIVEVCTQDSTEVSWRSVGQRRPVEVGLARLALLSLEAEETEEGDE